MKVELRVAMPGEQNLQQQSIKVLQAISSQAPFQQSRQRISIQIA